LNWDESYKNESLAIFSKGDVVGLNWTGGADDGYVSIKLYTLHGDARNILNELTLHVGDITPQLDESEFVGRLVYFGPNLHKYDWTVPSDLIPGRNFMLELESVTVSDVPLGYEKKDIHISIKGASSFDFTYIATAAAGDITVTFQDDYDHLINVVFTGPHTVGSNKKSISADMGEVKEAKTTSTNIESVLVSQASTGYVGVFGFVNSTGALVPSCYEFVDCRRCGLSSTCGWCESRHMCLPLHSDTKSWSKVVDCHYDPLHPDGFWSANGCLRYTACNMNGSAIVAPCPTKNSGVETLISLVVLLLSILL
jgi:hypothetical protein